MSKHKMLNSKWVPLIRKFSQGFEGSPQLIEVRLISDPRCPWCYVAHQRMERVLFKVCSDKPKINFRVAHLPYLLDDSLPKGGICKRTYYEKRFGAEAMQQAASRIQFAFEKEGIQQTLTQLNGEPFRYSIDGLACSSLPALRLIAMADHLDSSGVLGSNLSKKLFQTYFGAKKANIADDNVLVDIVVDINMFESPAEATTFLKSDAMTSWVLANSQHAKQTGLSVPHLSVHCVSSKRKLGKIFGVPEEEDLYKLLCSVDSNDVSYCEVINNSQSCAASQPAVDDIKTLEPLDQKSIIATKTDRKAAISYEWRSENLLPSMISAMPDGWPHDYPFNTSHFARLDPTSDLEFYQDPRMEQHVDASARALLSAHHMKAIEVLDLETRPKVLDICSSFESHLPKDLVGVDSFGVGLNQEELAANKSLNLGYRLEDLNECEEPLRAERGRNFDLATCALSIDYLTKPTQVLHGVWCALKPGGLFMVSFSDRMFRSKAVALWRDSDPQTRLWLVAAYFHYSVEAGGWEDITVLDLSEGNGDPLFVVQAKRAVVQEIHTR